MRWFFDEWKGVLIGQKVQLIGSDDDHDMRNDTHGNDTQNVFECSNCQSIYYVLR